MTQPNTFNILLLIARPAAGKSEIIDYLKRTPLAERRRRFHIAEFEEIDDFPMLYTWFEEDRILEEMGFPRLHTDENEYFAGDHLWNLLIRRICLDYTKKLRDAPNYHDTYTAVIEFARGAQHGGFSESFKHFDPQMLDKLAILYINVSWEESLRKNKARFNPERADSILEHGLELEKMEVMYKDSDWEQVSAPDPEYITIQGVPVPYVVFENEDDVTTGRGAALGQRLEENLSRLWSLYKA